MGQIEILGCPKRQANQQSGLVRHSTLLHPIARPAQSARASPSLTSERVGPPIDTLPLISRPYLEVVGAGIKRQECADDSTKLTSPTAGRIPLNAGTTRFPSAAGRASIAVMVRKPSRHVGTIGDIAFHGHTLTLNCERCRHRSELDLLSLIAAHGEDYLVRKGGRPRRVLEMRRPRNLLHARAGQRGRVQLPELRPRRAVTMARNDARNSIPTYRTTRVTSFWWR